MKFECSIRHYVVLLKLEKDVRENYNIACRKILLDYVLMDPDERQRVGIMNYPKSDYPSMLIRGPVPWHHMTIIQKEQLRHNLYNFREPILMLNDVWQKYE